MEKYPVYSRRGAKYKVKVSYNIDYGEFEEDDKEYLSVELFVKVSVNLLLFKINRFEQVYDLCYYRGKTRGKFYDNPIEAIKDTVESYEHILYEREKYSDEGLDKALSRWSGDLDE